MMNRRDYIKPMFEYKKKISSLFIDISVIKTEQVNFIKKCWDVVGKEVVNFVLEFYDNPKLPKAISASFLTIIPKKENPQCWEEYRPISLIGCLHKILVQILPSRLKKVLG